jgi:hypothetical protein
MSETALDAKIFYSANIVSKFKGNGEKLDTMSLPRLEEAGLNKMIDEGVAKKIGDLEDPYSLVVFPKLSPSRPYEIMMTVLPQHQDLPSRSSFINFTVNDSLRIFEAAQNMQHALFEQSVSDGHSAKDSYVYQHFNPYDLHPKTMFNGNISHLHLHTQIYGHSLKEFPATFSPDGILRNFEGANRLLRDTGVSMFYEIIRAKYPELHIEMKNSGSVSFGKVQGDTQISLYEVANFREIIQTWGEIWSEFESCFVISTHVGDNKEYTLLQPEERKQNILDLLKKHPLNVKNQKILLFLGQHVHEESPDVWRNFYHGPNGAIGFHTDFVANEREWVIAPRIFRSWARHLPLVSEQNDPFDEFTTKNESGDGLINMKAREEMYPIQQQTVSQLR